MRDSDEEWRPVVGYEGLYEVSNFGRVRATPRILATQFNCDRYGRVRLFNEHGGKRRSTHSLVAEAFIGPRPTPTHEVNHKDGNPSNNRVENLEYCTRLENMTHSFEVLRNPKPPQGLLHNSRARPETVPRGENSGKSKLKDADVRAIRARYAAGGVSQPALAREFGVTQRVIWMVVHRVTWKHVR